MTKSVGSDRERTSVDGGTYPAAELFTQMYSGGDKLTLQTYLAQDGILSWGRQFVTALPAN